MPLADITTGRVVAPLLAIVYGPPGAGKSTFAGNAKDPIFIQTERGTDQLDVARFPQSHSTADVFQRCRELLEEEHKFRTVVLDSLDWFERLAQEEIAQANRVESVATIPYGRGYEEAARLVRDLIKYLDALRNRKGMNVILVAHSQVRATQTAELEAYDENTLRLHKTVAAMMTEWVDHVLFAHFDQRIRKDANGKTKGVGSPQRMMTTRKTAFCVAKNRANLPETMPLEWSAFATAVRDHMTPSSSQPQADNTADNTAETAAK